MRIAISALATARADLGGSRKRTIEIPASASTAAVRRVLSSSSAAPPKPGASRRVATTVAAGQNELSKCVHCDGDNGQSQRPNGRQMSCESGRQSTASTARIGYSATHENAQGAINPANRPPTMPPKDNET